MNNISSLVGGIAVGIFLLPVFVSALTAEELAAQIQALLTQIAALQQQANSAATAGNTGLPVNLPAPNHCPDLWRSLSRGTNGPDVQSLQRYLAWQGFLSSDSSTGFFGPLTEGAVRDWQASRSIVSSGDAASTGWGVVGARTRAAIAAHCTSANASPLPVVTPSCPLAPRPATICSTGWQANTDANGCTISYKCSIPLSGVPSTSGSGVFAASPMAGAAPLTVTFYTSIQNPTSYAAGVYQIDYGDSRVDGIAGCSLANVCSLDSGTHTHVYATTGTYTARLIFINRSACTNSSVACTSGREVIASIPITVAGTTAGAPSISVSGSPASVAKGQNLAISWSSQNTPSDSVVLLRLVNAQTGSGEGIIARAQSTSGSYTWTVPTASSIMCTDCGGVQTVKVGSYKITAELYTPSNAYLGDTYPPINPPLPTYHAIATSTAFSITQ
ncbi:MAG: peptidoglycan-binding domain-containing protein [Patescibacteria group bacterium]